MCLDLWNWWCWPQEIRQDPILTSDSEGCSQTQTLVSTRGHSSWSWWIFLFSKWYSWGYICINSGSYIFFIFLNIFIFTLLHFATFDISLAELLPLSPSSPSSFSCCCNFCHQHPHLHHHRQRHHHLHLQAVISAALLGAVLASKDAYRDIQFASFREQHGGHYNYDHDHGDDDQDHGDDDYDHECNDR